ncbi:MAG: HD domain-containing protein [Flavobacteriia bacterium]|nr:HD domain-containing protein [Flavobacteriia bacterium]
MKASSKIINDPLYGFISLQGGIILNLIEHPFFQRLRRISQLGLTSLVYPGALHTRFHHAIGAMHLMQKAINVLRSKGHEISNEEAEGAKIAILLHDIGHGPYSHSLEHSIVDNISHEELSLFYMHKLNNEFNGKLDLAIQIFKDEYSKSYLHQLVSSQLDMDRMDYLNRDSFYSGVQEGVVGAERIINMLDVVNDKLVVESKGIYSVEKFLIARRLMYWQVYFHKTVVSAEQMLIKVLQRAKELSQNNIDLFGTSSLQLFLKNNFTIKDFKSNPKVFESFTELDDYDIMASIKEWQNHSDNILASLSNKIVKRELFKVTLLDEPMDDLNISRIKKNIMNAYNLDATNVNYFFLEGEITNNAYKLNDSDINILFKDNLIKDLMGAADKSTISALCKTVKKYFYCHPKNQLI